MVRVEDFAVAVKALIENKDGKTLLIKRSELNSHKPFIWEISGGRLEKGENPFEGLKREVKEKTNLSIEIKHPVRIHHFIREDGQKITMIVFFAKALSGGNKAKQGAFGV